MTKAIAAVLSRFDEPLGLREVPIPDPREGEVLVRILAAGVCGSDVHMWKGMDPRTPLPITLGHEGVGEVVAVAGLRKTVDGEALKRGDVVVWNRGVVCGIGA